MFDKHTDSELFVRWEFVSKTILFYWQIFVVMNNHLISLSICVVCMYVCTYVRTYVCMYLFVYFLTISICMSIYLKCNGK